MWSSRYVLWFFMLLAFVVGVGLSCQAEELEFDTKRSSDDSDKEIDVDHIPDGNDALDKGGGDYAGDPIVYVKPPSEVDPANRYDPYEGARRAPERSWVANELVTDSSDPMTIASKGNAPTRKQSITVITDRQTSDYTSSSEASISTPSINQVKHLSDSDTFTQTGTEATQTKLQSHSRTFAGRQAGLLDILLVIDTSGSMLQEIRSMAASLPHMMGLYGSQSSSRYYNYSAQHLHRTDWRIGLVASSPENDCEIVGVASAEGSTFDFPLPARDETHPANEDMKWRYDSSRYHSDWVIHGSKSGVATDQIRYYQGNNQYNPFLKIFMQPLTPGANADTNPGSEHMLKKVVWALNGKTDTDCKGNWVRDNASVAVIVATDEGHQCLSTDHTTCSIDNFKTFRDGFSHNMKIYGQLTGTKWTPDQKTVFAQFYEAIGTNSATNFGYHSSSFNGFGDDMLNDPGFLSSYIYSPLDPHPNAGSITVQTKQYSTNSLNDVEKCSPSVTANCYRELPSTQVGGKGAVQLVDYGHYNRNITYGGQRDTYAVLDGRSVVTVKWESGGKAVGGQPFVSSFTLDNNPSPDAASMTVTVVKKDGTTTTLTRGASDGYTLSGRTISVSSSDVKQIVPEGAKLKVDYKINAALQTSFNIGSAYQLPANAQLVPGSVRITIIDSSDRETTLSSGFSFDGYTVTFDSLSNAPAAGESFQLAYRYSQETTTSSVTETIITDYAYTKRDNTDSSQSLSCLSGGSSVSCTYTAPANSGEAGTISFSSDDLRKGDVIMVTEYLQRSGTGVSINSNVTLVGVGLPNCEMNEAVEMHLGAKKCSSLGSVADGKYLSVTSSGKIELLSSNDCGIISDILTGVEGHNAQVVFRCEKVAELPEDFLQMDKRFFEMHRGKYKFEYWQIMVNGQELQISDSDELLVEDYKITEIKGVDTSDADALRELLGGNDKRVKVVIRLYEAL